MLWGPGRPGLSCQYTVLWQLSLRTRTGRFLWRGLVLPAAAVSHRCSRPGEQGRAWHRAGLAQGGASSAHLSPTAPRASSSELLADSAAGVHVFSLGTPSSPRPRRSQHSKSSALHVSAPSPQARLCVSPATALLAFSRYADLIPFVHPLRAGPVGVELDIALPCFRGALLRTGRCQHRMAPVAPFNAVSSNPSGVDASL